MATGLRDPRSIKIVSLINIDSQQELDNRVQNSNLLRLVDSYRSYGHRVADLDPLKPKNSKSLPELDLHNFGLDSSNAEFQLNGIVDFRSLSDQLSPGPKLGISKIIENLETIYTSKIGYEFTHLPIAAERQWFARMVESGKPMYSCIEKIANYQQLVKSEIFDTFMSKKFPNVKRYGLEGSESMMIILNKLFQESNMTGVENVVLSMPHRGRLNLLIGLLNFPPEQLFHKVNGNSEFPNDSFRTGDVLSHLSTSTDIEYSKQKSLHVSLIHNPSHLEAGNPVALGKTRAKQIHNHAKSPDNGSFLGDTVLCIQIHGDAAFSGQGVVTETLALSNLPHFTVGGSIHIILNNQIGYTTSSINARSSVYASDIGKMIDAPVLHVNADHPEDVVHATQLAFAYRHEFRKDVIIDMVSYRRNGHNELDEPAFTQPLMYKQIQNQKSVALKYEEQLMADHIIDRAVIDQSRQANYQYLERKLEESKSFNSTIKPLTRQWSGMAFGIDDILKIDSGVEREKLYNIGFTSVQIHGIKIHPRIKKYHIDNRLRKLKIGKGLDWATCEALAFGSLLIDGFHVRISGQDVGRGTFSQRHAMFVDSETERTIIPLNYLTKRAKLEIANSHLSEYAVLAFEYGMSWESPNHLGIWEAQFGDFCNGAQIIIDSYLCSGESKWMRQSGLVLILPHGYDGGGPEHSSCRIERFLQLCDNGFKVDSDESVDPNMHVVNPTTPAQYFHVLRRQMLRNYRKPLIIAGPKSLLRSPDCTSTFDDMMPGTSWLSIMGDPLSNHSTARRLCFVSGKIYYDLVRERKLRNLDSDISFVRIEELNPFPTSELKAEITKYTCTDYYWVQEEPQNQGAYSFVAPRLQIILPTNVLLN